MSEQVSFHSAFVERAAQWLGSLVQQESSQFDALSTPSAWPVTAAAASLSEPATATIASISYFRPASFHSLNWLP